MIGRAIGYSVVEGCGLDATAARQKVAFPCDVAECAVHGPSDRNAIAAKKTTTARQFLGKVDVVTSWRKVEIRNE